MIDGKAGSISGVKASGNKLAVQLTKPSPDFLARTTMPFVQAIDTGLAGQIDANRINQYVVRAVLLRVAHAWPVDHAQAQHVLQGRPAPRTPTPSR